MIITSQLTLRVRNEGFQTPLRHNLNPIIPQDNANTKERDLVARELAPRLAMEIKTRTKGEAVPEQEVSDEIISTLIVGQI